MALTKIFIGTDATTPNDLNTAANFAPISIRNSSYQWTASGSGTNEYYLEASGGGTPGLVEPTDVQEAGTDLTAGTAGSLAVSAWDFGDNDGLGFSTIYVRTSGEVDPDSLDEGAITLTDVLKGGDTFIVASTAPAIQDGLDQSDITLAAVDFEDGYSGAVGYSYDYLRLTCTSFYFGGLGTAFIDLMASSIGPIIQQTAGGNNGEPGLTLKGTAIAELYVAAGDIELNDATVADLTVRSGNVEVSAGSSVTDIIAYPGAEVVLHQTATVTNGYAHGGTIDATQDRNAHTITNPDCRNGGRILYYSGKMTFTNDPTGDILEVSAV